MNAHSPEEIERIKRTPAYRRARDDLQSRNWRLDNLYKIRDETGTEVQFKRNEAQLAYDRKRWWRDALVKARQLGFSTYIGLEQLDLCMFRSGTSCGIVDRTQADAREKVGKIKYAYDRLPGPIKESRQLITDNADELEWSNGSRVLAGTSLRGGTHQYLHVSELGKISVDNPEKAKEIRLGSMKTVHASGRIVLESTAHGTGGEFYDIVKLAQRKQQQGTPMTPLDFAMHFYGWWVKREYRLPNNMVVVPVELKEYFRELQGKHGIKLDADQQAWYTKQHEENGPDDTKGEFPSCVEETFFRSVLGTFFQPELTKARLEGRIGQKVPHDPSRPVDTWWDIGEDCTAIGFSQSDGVRHRVIDYHEQEGWSLQGACGLIHQKARERGFVYGKHRGPHDFENREWGSNAQGRVAIAASLGVKIEAVPKVDDKADSIEAARRMLALTWFDVEHCARLVECLDNYRKVWNKNLSMFTSEPLHNWASHAADAYQQHAFGWSMPKPKQAARPQPPKSKGAWGA